VFLIVIDDGNNWSSRVQWALVVVWLECLLHLAEDGIRQTDLETADWGLCPTTDHVSCTLVRMMTTIYFVFYSHTN